MLTNSGCNEPGNKYCIQVRGKLCDVFHLRGTGNILGQIGALLDGWKIKEQQNKNPKLTAYPDQWKMPERNFENSNGKQLNCPTSV
ncbi:hypothetical protein AYI69_g10082 [Smittium culicis]|uniref:Uncharacterized protein n=1 Tax=Smittium culicis TaxID=133412 RepID=A0A1R1X8A9_9FUNG|nr:hypothetical protein AYI69_g10082 [Smittium culicis]